MVSGLFLCLALLLLPLFLGWPSGLLLDCRGTITTALSDIKALVNKRAVLAAEAVSKITIASLNSLSGFLSMLNQRNRERLLSNGELLDGTSISKEVS